jgi:hypothetical protein
VDNNSDGFLSHFELLEAFKVHSASKFTIDLLVAKFDTNKDGRISFEEFLKFLDDVGTESGSKLEVDNKFEVDLELDKSLKELFQLLDKNKKGSLDHVEFMLALKQLNIKKAKHQELV